MRTQEFPSWRAAQYPPSNATIGTSSTEFLFIFWNLPKNEIGTNVFKRNDLSRRLPGFDHTNKTLLFRLLLQYLSSNKIRPNWRLPSAVQENSASSSKLRRLVHLSMFVLILHGQFVIVRMHCVLCKLGYNQDWAFWVFRNLVMIFFFFPFAL